LCYKFNFPTTKNATMTVTIGQKNSLLPLQNAQSVINKAQKRTRF